MTRSMLAPAIFVYLAGKEILDGRLITCYRSTLRDGLLNQAEFVFAPSRSRNPQNSPFQSALIPWMGSRCDIVIKTREDEWPLLQYVHYGRVVAERVMRDQSQEDIVYISRLDPHMIGTVVTGRVTAKKLADEERYTRFEVSSRWDELESRKVGGDLVFNPIVDGVRMPNKQYVPEFQYVPLFVDIAQIPSRVLVHSKSLQQHRGLLAIVDAAASEETMQGAGVGYWTVAEAIWHLLWMLNPGQVHVHNPTPAHLEAAVASVLPDDSGQYLAGQRIPVGTTMVEALRLLCSPFGIDASIEFTNLDHRRWRFFTRRNAPNWSLPIAAIGAEADLAVESTAQLAVNIDVAAEAANVVEVVGGIPKVEVTIELHPGWDRDLDSMHNYQTLTRDVVDSDPELRRVGRDWVANETGEYDFDKPDMASIFVDQLPDLFDYLRDEALKRVNAYQIDIENQVAFVERRRSLKPMLTTDKFGNHFVGKYGVEIEFSVDGGETWDNVDLLEDQTIKILNDEIGVHFDGKLPPLELLAALSNDQARVRATGTIEGDSPLRVVAKYQADWLPDEKRVVSKLMDQLGYNVLMATGGMKSKYVDSVKDGTRSALVRDDYATALEIAVRQLEQYLFARAYSSVALSRLTWCPDVQEGDVLGTAVRGADNRGSSFKVSVDPRAVYPIVTSVRYDVASQQKQLSLDARRVVLER